MKRKITFAFLLLLHCLVYADSDYDYAGGNGTMLKSSTENGVQTTLRKCELEAVIGDVLLEKSGTLYEYMTTANPVGTVKKDDIVSISEICVVKYLNEEKKYGLYKSDIWFKIKKDGRHCWLCYCYQDYMMRDPYENGQYSIIGKIEINGKVENVRKLSQTLSVFENVNIRDFPDLKKGKTIYTIRPNVTDDFQTNVRVTGMMENAVRIDGFTDYWLKISYKGYEGWIFGGYAYAERGGPKYEIPEEEIKYKLGWY